MLLVLCVRLLALLFFFGKWHYVQYVDITTPSLGLSLSGTCSSHSIRVELKRIFFSEQERDVQL